MSKLKWDRQFLGEIIMGGGEKMTEAEKSHSRYEQKHLKAYLKGETEFVYGMQTIKDAYGNERRVPIVYQVKQILNKID